MTPPDVGTSNDGQHVTLWAYEEFGDAPEELTPSQARAVARELIAAAAAVEIRRYVG